MKQHTVSAKEDKKLYILLTQHVNSVLNVNKNVYSLLIIVPPGFPRL
jgi:hypothetical protein